MSSYIVSCDKDTLVNAVEAVMACVPKPWTPIMVAHATRAVLDVAHNWRNLLEYDIEEDPIYSAFLDAHRGNSETLIIPEGYDDAEYRLDGLAG